MKQLRYIFGLVAFLMFGALIGCSETEEESVYDHWQEKNDAYADSLLKVAGTNLFSTADDTVKVDAMPIGQLFGIKTRVSTNKNTYYVFCKKLSATEGRHPIVTDYFSVFYRGSYITGAEFDGNFDGYVATDTNLDATEKLPAVYDAPNTFQVGSMIPGWIAALQYMREGERWMLYVPYQSGYGSSSTAVLGYSDLIFDIILNGIVE